MTVKRRTASTKKNDKVAKVKLLGKANKAAAPKKVNKAVDRKKKIVKK